MKEIYVVVVEHPSGRLEHPEVLGLYTSPLLAQDAMHARARELLDEQAEAYPGLTMKVHAFVGDNTGTILPGVDVDDDGDGLWCLRTHALPAPPDPDAVRDAETLQKERAAAVEEMT